MLDLIKIKTGTVRKLEWNIRTEVFWQLVLPAESLHCGLDNSYGGRSHVTQYLIILSHSVQQVTSHLKYHSDTLMRTSLKNSSAEIRPPSVPHSFRFWVFFVLFFFVFLFFVFAGSRSTINYSYFLFHIYISPFSYIAFKLGCTGSLSLPHACFQLQDQHSIYLTSPSWLNSNRSLLYTGVPNGEHTTCIQFISWQRAAGISLK